MDLENAKSKSAKDKNDKRSTNAKELGPYLPQVNVPYQESGSVKMTAISGKSTANAVRRPMQFNLSD